MKRAKIGIALITMCGLLLGTAGVASAKTTSPVYYAKVSQVSQTTSTHHHAKSHVAKKSVHKSTKSAKTIKSVKTAKLTSHHTSAKNI